MNYLRNLKLSFLGIVFLVFIPSIILISISLAVLNYKQSYSFILNEIDNKLLSISSITASFIDGDEYKIVLAAKQMKAYTYDNKNDILYSIDQLNRLNFIVKKSGAARLVKDIDTKAYEINDISIDEANNIIYAVTKKNMLISINLQTKKISEIKKFDIKLNGIAFINQNEMFLTSENILYKLKNQEIIKIKEYEVQLDSLNYQDEKIYGVDRASDQYFEIEPSTLKLSISKIDEYPYETTALYSLAVGKDKIYMGNDHLVVESKKDKSLEHESFARMFRDEGLIEYKKYHEPMTKIKLALNLTYHYTLNLLYGDDKKNTYYIFDVHEGNEYSPIGSYDYMDHDDLIGAENVIYRDKAYVGEVKLWEKWGLLKVAYAGIIDSTGKVVGIAGTDVDISFIKSKTHEALVHSISIGLLTLVLSIIASYYIALKIIDPIEKLKSSALKIAAGKYDKKVFIKSPIELAELSDEFNYMSEQLTSEIKNFKNYTFEIKQRQENEKLEKKFYALNYFKDKNIELTGIDSFKNAYGVAFFDNIYYIWSAKQKFDSKIDASRKSAVMNDMLTRLLKTKQEIELFKEISQLESFIKLDTHNKKVYNILDGTKQDLNRIIDMGEIKVVISKNVLDRSF